ncbi:MAG: outer membrane protein assembly factor BamB [Nitrosomonas sp.]|nr:MAG: outer membrane protein assembly factor BamB [Nitrosomonas sp.]
MIVFLNFAKQGYLYLLAAFFTLWLPGCASSLNPFDMRIAEDLSTAISDIFEKEEVVVYEKEELDALKAANKIPLKWKDKLSENEVASFNIVSNRGAVYAADENGVLVKYDEATGKQLWRIKTKNRFSAGIGIGEGLILVGTSKGEVLAYNEDGHSVWQSPLTSEILSSPQANNNIVIVRTVDGRIFGLDALDGKRKWIYQGATPPLTVRSSAGTVITHGAVFAGFPGGKMVALSLFSGNLGWEAPVSHPRGVTELERMTDVASTPAANNRLVCAVAYRGRVGCFALNDGTQIWSRESSSSVGLALDNDYAYVTEENGVVAAYDLISGATMWKQSKLGSKKLTKPIITGQYVIVADHQGYVNVLRNYDGALIARAATDGSLVRNSIAPLMDGFAVQTAKGGIYAFSTQF